MRFRTISLSSLLAAIGLCTGTTVASVLHVDDDAPPAGDGQSWATAHRFLQDALAEAAGGDVTEIRVAQGLYLPDRDEADPGGTGLRERTFQLVNGVSLAGGYAGIGAPDPDDRDVSSFVTTLSGDLAGNDEPDFVNYDENSYHVVTGSDNDETAIIDGVTITAGNASAGDEENGSGGGMIIDDGDPTVRNCRFEFNRAGSGAGLDIRFVGEPANVEPAISGSTFLGNLVYVDGGGGMRCYLVRSTVTISNCSFIANRSTRDERGGGGFVNQGSDLVVITGSLFVGNYAKYEGGATVTNFGLPEFEPTTRLINSTVVANHADHKGGGVCSAGRGRTFVQNSIIHLNTALDGDPQIFNLQEFGESNTYVSCTNTEEGLDGDPFTHDLGGNIDADPQFVDSESGDFRLSSGSPSIDAGDNDAAAGITEDLDGNPRFQNDCATPDTGNGTSPIIDMGAFESPSQDLDDSGAVDFGDILAILSAWGNAGGPEDLNGSGAVDFGDLLVVLAAWGPCK